MGDTSPNHNTHDPYILLLGWAFHPQVLSPVLHTAIKKLCLQDLLLEAVNLPKGPCTHIVYTLALKYSPYRYIGPKVYAIWVHGPLGLVSGSMGA